jgi:hypothetical protein
VARVEVMRSRERDRERLETIDSESHMTCENECSAALLPHACQRLWVQQNGEAGSTRHSVRAASAATSTHSRTKMRIADNAHSFSTCLVSCDTTFTEYRVHGRAVAAAIWARARMQGPFPRLVRCHHLRRVRGAGAYGGPVCLDGKHDGEEEQEHNGDDDQHGTSAGD